VSIANDDKSPLIDHLTCIGRTWGDAKAIRRLSTAIEPTSRHRRIRCWADFQALGA